MLILWTYIQIQVKEKCDVKIYPRPNYVLLVYPNLPSKFCPKYDQFCTDTVGFSKHSKKMSLSSLPKQFGFQSTSLQYWLDQVFLAPLSYMS